jgi:hypothetical protein
MGNGPNAPKAAGSSEDNYPEMLALNALVTPHALQEAKLQKASSLPISVAATTN